MNETRRTFARRSGEVFCRDELGTWQLMGHVLRAPDGWAFDSGETHGTTPLRRDAIALLVEPTQSPAPEQITFITSEGDHYADVPVEELEATARLFLAELLEHIDDERYVLDLITGLSLLEGLPSELVFGSTIRILVTEILASLQLASPELSSTFQVAAEVLRQEKRA